MADISTLKNDIYKMLESDDHKNVIGEDREAHLLHYGKDIVGATTKTVLTSERKPREKGKYWATDLGKSCFRQSWYNFNGTEGEPLDGQTRFKFMYGDTIESKVLLLAKLAGHEVTMEQERLEHEDKEDGWVVSGKTDAMIDNVLIDVKSASPFAFQKYTREGINHHNDSFGYLAQLSFYENTMVKPKDYEGCGFLFVDKANGEIEFVAPDKEDLWPASRLVETARQLHTAVVHDEPPRRAHSPLSQGASGNEKLGTACRYCQFKHTCWPGLRTFRYSNGPVYLTRVAKVPNVDEIT